MAPPITDVLDNPDLLHTILCLVPPESHEAKETSRAWYSAWKETLKQRKIKRPPNAWIAFKTDFIKQYPSFFMQDDENKRPPNSWVIFKTHAIATGLVTGTFAEMAKAASALWAKMTEKEKEPYVTDANERMDAYKAAGGKFSRNADTSIVTLGNKTMTAAMIWNAMSEEQKAPYKHEANKRMKAYRDAVGAYTTGDKKAKGNDGKAKHKKTPNPLFFP